MRSHPPACISSSGRSCRSKRWRRPSGRSSGARGSAACDGRRFKQSIRRPRLLAQLLTLFCAIALVLAAIGTYGTLAFTVAERRRELGIRLALGAERRWMLRDVMAQGLTPAGIGVLCGLAGGVGMSRVLSSLLFGVQPVDVLTLSIAVLTILLTAAGASWLLAWRASRLDPSLVLRGE